MIYLALISSEMKRSSHFVTFLCKVVSQEKKINFGKVGKITSMHAVTMVPRENYGVVKNGHKALRCKSIINNTAEPDFKAW